MSQVEKSYECKSVFFWGERVSIHFDPVGSVVTVLEEGDYCEDHSPLVYVFPNVAGDYLGR